MTTYDRDRLLAELDDRSDQELFDLLDDEAQQRLKADFISSLDDADVYSAVFFFIGGAQPEDETHHRNYFNSAWLGYLADVDIRNRFASKLEDVVLSAA
jgi:hypothetical protein